MEVKLRELYGWGGYEHCDDCGDPATRHVDITFIFPAWICGNHCLLRPREVELSLCMNCANKLRADIGEAIERIDA